MLRKNTLFENISDILPNSRLPAILHDFLSDRKCIIDVNGQLSSVFDVHLGCVQGSVLGPKLFNLYTRHIPSILSKNSFITTFADDSYVLVSAKRGNTAELIKETELCLRDHIAYLKGLGMVVNSSKTELIHLGSNDNGSPLEIKIDGTTLQTKTTLKVLGIHMDHRLTWSYHIAQNINKMNRLTGALQYVRQRVTKGQFLTIMTSQYYSSCFYACQAWLGHHTRYQDLRKLNSLHYRLLRTAVNDWKCKIKRNELNTLGRARPSLWSKYSCSNIVIKILRDRVPPRLHRHILSTMYHERRRQDAYKFYDASNRRIGRQAIANRLKDTFDEINLPLTLMESNDSIRIKLINALGFVKQDAKTKDGTDCYLATRPH